jgi:hypothetical protein
LHDGAAVGEAGIIGWLKVGLEKVLEVEGELEDLVDRLDVLGVEGKGAEDVKIDLVRCESNVS